MSVIDNRPGFVRTTHSRNIRPTRVIDRIGIIGRFVFVLILASAPLAKADSIRSIVIDHLNVLNPPLEFDADGGRGGLLTIDIDSFSVFIDRTVGNSEETELVPDASFHLTATAMSDESTPPQAAGVFDMVEFELYSGQELLLHGLQQTGAQLSYSETAFDDTMGINGSPIEIIGGSLEAEFENGMNLPARLFGISFLISPGTANFDILDTDHTGSLKMELLPVPEPGALLFAIGGTLLCCVVGGRSSRGAQVGREEAGQGGKA